MTPFLTAHLPESIWSRLLFWFLLLLVFSLSFYLYSPVYYTGLNSDYALHALMAEDFRLPEDLYIWGENRIGSLLPMLAVPLVKLGITGLWAMSVVQYTVLLLSFFIWQSFFRSLWVKLALMFILFIPIYPWQEFVMISHPVTLFVFFFGLSALLFEKAKAKIALGAFSTRDYWMAAAVGFVGLWSTEQLLVPLGLLWLVLLFPNGLTDLSGLWRRLRNDETIRRIALLPIPVFLGVAALKLAFVHRTQANFSKFVTPAEFVDQFGLIIFRLKKVLSFDHYLWLSVFTWLCVLSILLLLSVFIQKKSFSKAKSESNAVPDIVFLFSAVAMFLMVLLSKWVLVNFTEPRYFVPVVFSMAIFLFKKAENTKLSFAFAFLMAFGAFTAFEQNNFYNTTDDTIIRRRKLVEKLEITRPTGIIASYWFAYLSGAVHSPMALATVFPGDNCRNPHQVDEVLSKPEIVLINNLWQGELTDTMHMYSRTLVAIAPYQVDGLLYYRRYRVLGSETTK
jgi:hypothetical protein